MSQSITSLPNREPVLFAGVVASLVLGGALMFQLAGYPPCELCWWQRYPYMAIMALSLAALIPLRKLPARESKIFGFAALVLVAGILMFRFFAPATAKWEPANDLVLVLLVLIPVAPAFGLIFRGHKRRMKLTLVLLTLLFVTDAGIAAFHVGVEQRWWEGLSTCSGYVDITDSINDALDAIMKAPVIRCDEIAWSLFGISMAGYNFMIALVMTLFCAKKAKEA